MKKRRSSGIFAIIVFLVVLLVPTYIAIISFNRTENKPPEVKDSSTLTLSDINGAEFNFADDNEDGKAMKELFVQLDFDLNFAESAADMLQLIRTGSRYSEIDNAEAIRKLSVIERSLEEIENR